MGFKYVFITGLSLIGNSWLMDHWRPDNNLPFLFWGRWDIRMFSYSIGLTLIFITAILFAAKHFYSLLAGGVRRYRKKYPIEDIGITYNLVWFNGKLILFDKRQSKYYHVYPWQTAEDLDFVSYGTSVKDNFPNPTNKAIDLDDGSKLDIAKYSNGGSINTQR